MRAEGPDPARPLRNDDVQDQRKRQELSLMALASTCPGASPRPPESLRLARFWMDAFTIALSFGPTAGRGAAPFLKTVRD